LFGQFYFKTQSRDFTAMILKHYFIIDKFERTSGKTEYKTSFQNIKEALNAINNGAKILR